MLRDKLIDTAVKFGIDEQLRNMRAALPSQRRGRVTEQNLRLLLTYALTEDSNCIDIGAYRDRILAEMLRVAPQRVLFGDSSQRNGSEQEVDGGIVVYHFASRRPSL